ncbi:hypothetical protein IFM89_025683 [Coptis chinensis]|uniref:Uncharacterized protein n=1 Tax=Coptis chinensis TaxID=261450 RepID=A0A835H0X3_9MAGN|nr:hypothetical protein IFM89_025683 [Coptis chinensis]
MHAILFQVFKTVLTLECVDLIRMSTLLEVAHDYKKMVMIGDDATDLEISTCWIVSSLNTLKTNHMWDYRLSNTRNGREHDPCFSLL